MSSCRVAVHSNLLCFFVLITNNKTKWVLFKINTEGQLKASFINSFILTKPERMQLSFLAIKKLERSVTQLFSTVKHNHQYRNLHKMLHMLQYFTRFCDIPWWGRPNFILAF